MDKRKGPVKASGRKNKEEDEQNLEADHLTPGAAEGDLETIEQDLAQREQGGPEE